MATWDDILTARDKEVFAKSGYGKRAGYGERPAVLVIDMNYNFVGDKPEPIVKSVERFRNSCGEEGWEGVYRIRELLAATRKKNLPTFYTTGHEGGSSVAYGRWHGKNSRGAEDIGGQWAKGNDIVAEIAPQAGDILVPQTEAQRVLRHAAHQHAERAPRRHGAGHRLHHQRLRARERDRRLLL